MKRVRIVLVLLLAMLWLCPQSYADTAGLSPAELQSALKESKAAGDELRYQEIRQEMARRHSLESPQLPARVPSLDQGGDDCFSATDLIGQLLPLVVSGNTTGLTNTYDASSIGPQPPCWQGFYDEFASCFGPDVFYLWEAPYSSNFVISLCGSSFDTGLMLWENVCPPVYPTNWICGDDDACGPNYESQLSVSLNAGEQVLIQVDGYGSEQGSYDLVIQEGVLGGDNDECEQAEFVEVIPGGDVFINGSTGAANPDFVFDCDLNEVTSPGVWYAVPGTGGTITASTCLPGTLFDTRLILYDGDCAEALNCLDQNDDFCGQQSEISWCSDPLTLYYLLVAGSDIAQAGDFEMVISDDGIPCGSGPPNDDCFNAEQINPGDVLTGTLIDATEFPVPDCGLGTGPNVFYQFFLPTTSERRVTLSTCATVDPLLDLRIRVYEGDCESLICVASGDDECDNKAQAEFCAEPFTDYFVEISAGSHVNEFELEMFIDQHCNDDCESAQEILPGQQLPGNTIDAPLAIPVCDPLLPPMPTLWYSFQGTGDVMSIVLEPQFPPLQSLQIHVYRGGCDGLECVGSATDPVDDAQDLTFCTSVEEYHVAVGSLDDESFDLSLFDRGLPCPIYTIPELYLDLPSFLGQQVTIRGYTTDDSPPLLVANPLVWQTNEQMPPGFCLELLGQTLDPIYEDGQEVLIEGVIGQNPTAEPDNQGTLLIATNAPGAVLPRPNRPPYPGNWRPSPWSASATCDTCKFALILSGGVNSLNNRSDYWDDLADFYCYKRSHEYCEDNIKVFYFKGDRPTAMHNSRNTAIPAGVVDSARLDYIENYIEEVSKKVKACRAMGKPSMFEFISSNHGKKRVSAANPGGINLLRPNVLGPDKLTEMMQTLIDSGLTTLDIEMGQCYSGQMVDSLRADLDAKQCNVTAASATDAGHATYSNGGDGGYNFWLNAKACALQNNQSIQRAIQLADSSYNAYIQNDTTFARAYIAHLLSKRTAQDSASAQAWQNWLNGASTAAFKNQYWRAFQCTTRCHAETLQVKPGGTISITFSGNSAGCGNSEIICQDTMTGRWRRAKSWNWNIPGSASYQAGNNMRTFESDSGHTGIYVIHSRTRTPFNVKITSTPPARLTSPSNPETFAGFSIGWRSGSTAELGSIIAAYYNAGLIDGDGFDLSTTPGALGPLGVQELEFSFDVVQENVWWEDMELFFTVLSAPPGAEIAYDCPDCDNPNGSVALSGGAEDVILPVGSINQQGIHSMTLTTVGTIVLDCWGFESAQSTAAPGEVDDLVIQRTGDDVVLTWSAAPAAGSYLIQTASSPSGPWTDLDTTAGTTYTHANQAADPTEKLFYQVISMW